MDKRLLYIGAGLLALYFFMRYKKNKTTDKLTSGCGCGANAQANAQADAEQSTESTAE